MTEAEAQIVNRAIGRIFRLAARSERVGDAAEYMRCRSTILALTEGMFDATDQRPDYPRDCRKGAAGD